MKILISPKLLAAVLALTAQTFLSVGCGSKSDSDEPENEAGTATGLVNALSAAYPGALAISVFPEASAGLRLQTTGTGEKSYQEKVKAADKRVRGEGECFDKEQLAERKVPTSVVTCYEFDSDMNPSTFADRPNQSWGTKDGTDGKGQACMVTFAKDQVDDVTHKVDRALAMVQGLICRAKKVADAEGAEVKKPEPDADPVDFKTAANAGLPADAPIKFTTAQVSAVTNEDDSITYVTEITVTNPFGKSDSLVLRHTPAEEEGGKESGVLSFTREPLGAALPNAQANDPNKESDKYDVMAISYSKSKNDDGTSRMTAELNQAKIAKTYDPLTDDGLVNFEGLPEQAQNGDVHAIKYVSFDLNPETGAGNLSYWMNPGGSKQESARGFLFALTADSTGKLAGCGISGATAGVSIRAVAIDSTKKLEPVRYWHPRYAQNTSADKDNRYTASEGSAVTEQCFQQASEGGKYVIDKSKVPSARGYEVKATAAVSVKPPQRPPEPKLPPLPPPAGGK